MKVKICGITTIEDALAAAEAGADMLGFNFYVHSPRYILASACARMVGALRARGANCTAVGVFVNTPPVEVLHLLDLCGLELAQLSGDEPPDELAQLGSRAFKAVRPADLAEANAAAAVYRRDNPPALLLDANSRGHFGGTGRKSDWDLARTLARQHAILLAGGLTPKNVAQAVRHVHPWGVDVASGVEFSPGRKDHGKMVEFVREATHAEVN